MSPQTVGVRVFKAGQCWHPEFIVCKGGAFSSVTFPSTVACIEHPTQGLILFDVGYSPRFNDVTRTFPNRLYRMLTPVDFTAQQSLPHQMSQAGLAPEDVSLIVLSHFHADHIGGLESFPKARIICHSEAWEAVRPLSGFAAVTKGFLREFIPNDFESRARYLKKSDFSLTHPALMPGTAAADLLGDGSVLAVELPGHAPGHIGLYVHSHQGDLFFIADSCWQSRSFQRNLLPHSITRLLFDDFTAYKKTLSGLHSMYATHPELLLVPCHCTEAWNALKSRGLTHTFTGTLTGSLTGNISP